MSSKHSGLEMGLIDGEAVDSVGGAVVMVVRSPGGAKWWQSYRAAVAPLVVDYLDRRIADPDENPITWDEIWPYWARWLTQDRRHDEHADKTAVEQQT